MTDTTYSSTALWSGGSTSIRFASKRTKFNKTVPLILAIPGHGSTPNVWDQGSLHGQHLAALAEAGYIVLVVDQQNLWSSDARMTELSLAVAYAQAPAPAGLGCKPGQIGLYAMSLGGGEALNYAKRHLSQIAAVWLFCPATDYDYHYANGYGAELDAAYGGNYAANKTGHVPIADASTFDGAGLPIHIVQGSADTTVLPAHTSAYVAAASDANVRQEVAPGATHVNVPHFVSPSDIVKFFRAHLF